MSNSMNWWQLLPRLYPSLAARSHWLWGLSFSFLVTAKATVTLYCILQGMKVMSFQRRKIYDLLEADALTNIANRRTIYSFLSYLSSVAVKPPTSGGGYKATPQSCLHTDGI
jgi:hypothetical protein